jgi:hypothetical protein
MEMPLGLQQARIVLFVASPPPPPAVNKASAWCGTTNACSTTSALQKRRHAVTFRLLAVVATPPLSPRLTHTISLSLSVCLCVCLLSLRLSLALFPSPCCACCLLSITVRQQQQDVITQMNRRQRINNRDSLLPVAGKCVGRALRSGVAQASLRRRSGDSGCESQGVGGRSDWD